MELQAVWSVVKNNLFVEIDVLLFSEGRDKISPVALNIKGWRKFSN
jgi:hypothetical protein